MAFIGKLARSCHLLTRHCLQFERNIRPTACFISTSKKNKDAVIATKTITEPETTDMLSKDENWISYGYSLVDREEDELTHHVLLFFGITVCLVGGGYYLAYQPDYREQNWSQREAYLELARREQEGLPLIDKNLISPDQINLPDEEEIRNYEIII